MFRLDRFELDGHFFACRHVGAQINVAKGATADFAAEPVLFAHAQFHSVAVQT